MRHISHKQRLQRALPGRSIWPVIAISLSACSIESNEPESTALALATTANGRPASAQTVSAADTDAGEARESVVGRTRGTPGQLAGTTTWIFPDTANGLQPNQSWFSVAGSPNGTIYATACDHETNSAIYRVRPGSDALEVIGDARTASERANNWLTDETAEKFHVRPLWHEGRVYVATADYSNQDDVYLEHRGFHWYAFDERRQRFRDLSAATESGIGAEHMSIFSTALDAQRGYIYGLGSPTANLYQLDVARGVTVDLGRAPELGRPYYNPGRLIWVDHEGVVYSTVGNAGTLGMNDTQAPKYVLSWGAEQGWKGHPEWPISEMLRTGQRSLDGKRMYVMDYPLHLYVFNEDDRSFKQIAAGTLDDAHVSPRTKGVRVRAMALSANERKIYFVNDTAPTNSLWEWEFANGGQPRELTTMEAIDPRLDARYNAFTGHDSWDNAGRFSVTGFGGEGAPVTPYVVLVRIDPVRLKAALGKLPGAPVVELRRTADFRSRRHELRRSGELSSALDVIVEVKATRGAAVTHRTLHIPANETRLALPDDLARASSLRVVPDGDTYAVPQR